MRTNGLNNYLGKLAAFRNTIMLGIRFRNCYTVQCNNRSGFRKNSITEVCHAKLLIISGTNILKILPSLNAVSLTGRKMQSPKYRCINNPLGGVKPSWDWYVSALTILVLPLPLLHDWRMVRTAPPLLAGMVGLFKLSSEQGFLRAQNSVPWTCD